MTSKNKKDMEGRGENYFVFTVFFFFFFLSIGDRRPIFALADLIRLRDVLFLHDDKVKRPEQESRSSSSSRGMPKES